MKNYKNSSVLITGASQGIGRSIAITFASLTDRPLLLLARNKRNLEVTRKLCIEAGSTTVKILRCDATSAYELKKLRIPDGIPNPGIIVNNAGSYLYKPLADTTDEEFRMQVDTNLFTAVNIVNRFLTELKQLDHALIVNICSVASLRGLDDSGAYAASKHALLGYTRSLREELKETNVAVTAINLGQTHSPSWNQSEISPDRLINPTDVASLIVSISNLSVRSTVEEMTIQPQNGRVPSM